MDKRRIISILLMVLCLGIFFYSIIQKRGEQKGETETKAEYSEGDFRNQGELWDYMHSHAFVSSECDTISLTVKNFNLYLNGEKFSDKLEMCDFQYKAAGFTGYDIMGKKLRIMVVKQDTICSLTDISDSNKMKLYIAKP